MYTDSKIQSYQFLAALFYSLVMINCLFQCQIYTILAYVTFLSKTVLVILGTIEWQYKFIFQVYNTTSTKRPIGVTTPSHLLVYVPVDWEEVG